MAKKTSLLKTQRRGTYKTKKVGVEDFWNGLLMSRSHGHAQTLTFTSVSELAFQKTHTEAYLRPHSALRIFDLGVVHARAFWSLRLATRATSQWPAVV